ncbi:MAG: transporter [Gemmatimonadetes bacterium]|nr:transporter [Gemmatimonadota bacterium]
MTRDSTNAVDVSNLAYRYDKVAALNGLYLRIPEGALYALLGANGSGKTTLLQVLMGIRVAQQGSVSILGSDISALTIQERARIGYVAEGQRLPRWMRLEQLEAYLAPLYATWDFALASQLRTRLDLDPARKLSTLSRGEYMKAALLCALAPRPKILLMDEPFTGMDVMVKDDLIRGVLDTAGSEGWTVIVSSHDIGELETMADWVGIMGGGRMRISEPMDTLRERFRYVDVTLGDAGSVPVMEQWIAVERAGQRLSFLVSNADDALAQRLTVQLPGATRVDVRDATLREVFVAMSKRTSAVAS